MQAFILNFHRAPHRFLSKVRVINKVQRKQKIMENMKRESKLTIHSLELFTNLF